MKNLTKLLLVLLIGSATGANTAWAQLASSKATADVNALVVCKLSTAESPDNDITLPASCTDIFSGQSVSTNSGGWIKIMEKPLKTPSSNSLFVNVSLVTGLYTQTRTKTTTSTTSTFNTSTAEAMGGVYLRAVVEDAFGNELLASPLNLCDNSSGPAVYGCVDPTGDNDWGVILNSRIQTLTQSLSACLVNVTDLAGSILAGTCSFTSVIDLTLNTTSAHSFNFIFENLGKLNGSGIYTIKVYAAVASNASIVGSGAAVGAAVFGLGSMTAEKVRLVHEFDFN
jgi:hypothetical protein